MGTGPFYDRNNNILYYVDKSCAAQVYRYDLSSNTFFTGRVLGEAGLSFIFPVEGSEDKFIVGAGNRLLLIKWDGLTTTITVKLVLVELPNCNLRFNDAKIDSNGRLYVGTMINGETGDIFDFTKRLGSLYSYTLNEGLIELKSNVGFGNGIAFDEKAGKMYFVDSFDLNIKQYSWDIRTGKISDEKVFVDLTSFGIPKIVFPDGLTVDIEGFVYCAMFGGSKVLKINPRNLQIVEISLPVEQITSMTFGGRTLDSMFFTTSAMDNSRFMKGGKEAKITYPNGYVFKIENMGVIGTEFYNFRTSL